MNPYLIIAALLSVLAAGAGGFKLGADHQLAAQAREQNHIAEAVDAANTAAAQAIAQIKPKYTTIQNEVQREIRTNTVFADCKLPADSLRLVNQALNGGAEAPGGGKLPGADAPKR
jgi:uncharacterized protein HemX